MKSSEVIVKLVGPNDPYVELVNDSGITRMREAVDRLVEENVSLVVLCNRRETALKSIIAGKESIIDKQNELIQFMNESLREKTSQVTFFAGVALTCCVLAMALAINYVFSFV